MGPILFFCLLALNKDAVFDGDTFRCSGDPPIHVRVFGVDTPERGEALWREARDGLRVLIRGELLYCQLKGVNQDRLVAQCRRWRDGLDPAEDLVRSGLATDCPRYSRHAYARYAPPGIRPPAAQCLEGPTPPPTPEPPP